MITHDPYTNKYLIKVPDDPKNFEAYQDLLLSKRILSFRQYMEIPFILEAKQMDADFTIESREGTIEGERGDYLVWLSSDEIYSCPRIIFEARHIKMGFIKRFILRFFKKRRAHSPLISNVSYWLARKP